MRGVASLLLLGVIGCAQPAPTLTPQGLRVSQANEVAVALTTIRHAATELNKVSLCNPVVETSSAPPCQLLLSDTNTRIVLDAVDDALTTLRGLPDSWKATGYAAVARIEGRLDLAGRDKLKSYLTATQNVITSLSG